MLGGWGGSQVVSLHCLTFQPVWPFKVLILRGGSEEGYLCDLKRVEELGLFRDATLQGALQGFAIFREARSC